MLSAMSGRYIARLIRLFIGISRGFDCPYRYVTAREPICASFVVGQASGIRGKFGCEVRLTVIWHAPSCDELCLSQPVAVLPVRRRFLSDRPSLADGSPVHCRRPESLSDPPAEGWDLVACGSVAQRCAHTQRYRGRPKGVVMMRQGVTALV